MIWQFSIAVFICNVQLFGGVDQSELRGQLEIIVGDVPEPTASPTVRAAAKEYIIGRHFAGMDMHAQAISHFRLAAKEDLNAPSPWVGIAISHSALGRSAKASIAWREVLKRDPTHGDALFILGLNAANSQDFEQATQLLSQRWLQQDDDPVEALLRDAALQVSLIATEQQVAAESLRGTFQAIFQNAVANLVQDANRATWISVLQQLIDLHATPVAIQVIREAAPIVGQKEQGTLLTALPVLEASMEGDGSITLDVYQHIADENSIPLAPRWFEPVSLAKSLSVAARSMSLLGASDAPISLYEASLKLEPDNPLALNNISWLRLLRDGPTDEVVALCRRTIELDSESSYVKDTVGWMHVLRGDPAQGITLLIEALQSDGQPSSETYDHLGDAYWIIGQHDNAVRAWQTAAGLLHAAETRQAALDGYRELVYSVWGIHVTTPEALYDLEVGELIQRLKDKLASVEEGRAPQVGAAEKTGGAH